MGLNSELDFSISVLACLLASLALAFQVLLTAAARKVWRSLVSEKQPSPTGMATQSVVSPFLAFVFSEICTKILVFLF